MERKRGCRLSNWAMKWKGWDKTCTAVRYELYWYRLRKGIPLKEYDSLHSVAAYGREDMPEYFGAYSVPQHTPRGYTLRYRQILRGEKRIKNPRTDWRRPRTSGDFCGQKLVRYKGITLITGSS